VMLKRAVEFMGVKGGLVLESHSLIDFRRQVRNK